MLLTSDPFSYSDTNGLYVPALNKKAIDIAQAVSKGVIQEEVVTESNAMSLLTIYNTNLSVRELKAGVGELYKVSLFIIVQLERLLPNLSYVIVEAKRPVVKLISEVLRVIRYNSDDEVVRLDRVYTLVYVSRVPRKIVIEWEA